MIVGALFSSLRWVNNDTFSPRRIDWKAECLFFFGSLCMLGSQKVGTRTFGLEEQVMQRNTLISGTQMASQIGQIRDTLRKHQ
jgi:hypothetical protein